MLVRDGEVVIGQPAHAWLSGQLARAWGNDAFPAPAPREPVCLAAEQHDVGWADADLAPLPGPDGRPLPFTAMRRPVHVEIWRGAADRLLAQSRYAALLVSLHGTSLYERYPPGPEHAELVGAYMRRERARQAALSAGLDPDEVDRNRRLILALDRLSLALCHGEATTLEDVPGGGTIRVTPGGDGGGTPRDDRAVPADTPAEAFTVDPWPFGADAVAVGCEGRRLAAAPRDAAALRDALADAPWVPLRWVLSRS